MKSVFLHSTIIKMYFGLKSLAKKLKKTIIYNVFRRHSLCFLQ